MALSSFFKKSISIILLCTLVFCLVSCDTRSTDFLPITENEPLTAEQIYEKTCVSVVEITAESKTFVSTGSGFFYDNKGTVITNYHVIEGCTEATITLKNGTSYAVTGVKGYDEEKDIAILSTACKSSTPLELRKEEVVTGEAVYAIGSPLGLSGSFSDGIVSSIDRYINGNKYIQTTAPISHGNSGGPLVDKNGYLIGITSASFSEGQNLNFAIPIAEVETIDTTKPTSLQNLFKQRVKWISQRDFFYYEREESFVLLFELSDKNEVPMASSGLAEIRIVNADGVTVYEKTLAFLESDFGIWTRGEDEYYLASLYISPDDIDQGTCTTGKIYFTISGANYYFSESSLTAKDLPTLPVHVQLSEQPISLNCLDYRGVPKTTVRIDGITHEMANGDLKVYFAGEKIYDVDGNRSTASCALRWKVCDAEGFVVDSGTTFFSSLMVGDKFKNEYIWVEGVEYGETYTLILLDY